MYSKGILCFKYNFQVALKKVASNGYEQYIRSRPNASADSNRRIKELPLSSCWVHPVFQHISEEIEEERENLLDKMKTYRPHGVSKLFFKYKYYVTFYFDNSSINLFFKTIFEICGKNKSTEYQIMKQKRAFHKEKISTHHQRLEQKQAEVEDTKNKDEITLENSNNDDINDAFSEVVIPKKRKMDSLYKKNKKQKLKDENYIPYTPIDQHTEQGYV